MSSGTKETGECILMHTGKIVARQGKYSVIDCETCGFRHLDPIPSDTDINEFYQKQYFDLIKEGGRAQEIKRLMTGGEEAEAELTWLKSTLYSDINRLLQDTLPKGKRNLCDIGCGTGDFLRYMNGFSWNCTGIEPSETGTSFAEESCLTIFNESLEDFIRKNPVHAASYDAITLLNVLEHIPHPELLIQQVKHLLKPEEGIVCIRVPNDFSALQEAAQKKNHKPEWWVAIPDHINYFSPDSLEQFLSRNGFRILHRLTDFPMEFFLLMGDDYVNNPEIGNICHKKRVSLELALPDELRYTLARCFAENSVGRDCLVIARMQ